jgi:DNA replication protein DnaC
MIEWLIKKMLVRVLIWMMIYKKYDCIIIMNQILLDAEPKKENTDLDRNTIKVFETIASLKTALIAIVGSIGRGKTIMCQSYLNYIKKYILKSMMKLL